MCLAHRANGTPAKLWLAFVPTEHLKLICNEFRGDPTHIPQVADASLKRFEFLKSEKFRSFQSGLSFVSSWSLNIVQVFYRSVGHFRAQQPEYALVDARKKLSHPLSSPRQAIKWTSEKWFPIMKSTHNIQRRKKFASGELLVNCRLWLRRTEKFRSKLWRPRKRITNTHTHQNMHSAHYAVLGSELCREAALDGEPRWLIGDEFWQTKLENNSE